MYSIGLKLSRSTILFLTIALACGFVPSFTGAGLLLHPEQREVRP